MNLGANACFQTRGSFKGFARLATITRPSDSRLRLHYAAHVFSLRSQAKNPENERAVDFIRYVSYKYICM